MGALTVVELSPGPAALEWGVAAAPFPGEATSGDRCLVRPVKDGYMIAVIDGVGHGEAAAAAAEKAVAILEYQPHRALAPIVRQVHDGLIGSRGAVMTVALVNTVTAAVSWIGIGNICGVLVRAMGRSAQRAEAIAVRAGVVGLQLPTLQASQLSLAPGDVIALATDGIRPEFIERLSPVLSPQQLAERVLSEYGRGTDDALVFVGKYRGTGGRAE